MKKRFQDKDHALTTISIFGLVFGIMGFAFVIVGVIHHASRVSSPARLLEASEDAEPDWLRLCLGLGRLP